MSQYAFVNLADECLCGGPPSGKLADVCVLLYIVDQSIHINNGE